MSQDKKLTAWIELIEATPLINPKMVAERLNCIGKGDPCYASAGVTFSEDGRTPLCMEIIYSGRKMFDFAHRLDAVAELLNDGEYLLFEEKTQRNLDGESSTRVIIVANGTVEFMCGCSFYWQLKTKVLARQAKEREQEKKRAQSRDTDFE
jgi:hypothetical protein